MSLSKLPLVEPIAVLRGDYPDPSLVRVGHDYYMTHSSCMYGPGLQIWHSSNLTDWIPIGYALESYIGDVWAPDLVYVNDRFYIYFPANDTNYVIYADRAEGPWSTPIDLGVGGIDPGHLLGDDGTRYLFLNFGRVVKLSADGLNVADDAMIRVYDGWEIPVEWATEGKALESPKLFKRGPYYYMVSAQGGTAGPATSHMVIVARSKSPLGTWENSPLNPLVHTWTKEERWWSKGHGTLFDTPDGKWYIVYHAYEKDYYTLGRHTLLDSVEWTDEGWPRLAGATNEDKRLDDGRSPALSDDFMDHSLGWQWRFYKEFDPGQYEVGDGVLKLRAKGNTPANSAPLVCIPPDQSYEAEVRMKVGSGAEAGLILFYNERCYAGIGFNEHEIFRLRRGARGFIVSGAGSLLHLRLRNEQHTVSMYYSIDGTEWTKFPASMDVSAYHHNAFGEFVSLRLGFYAAGQGEVEISSFHYKAI